MIDYIDNYVASIDECRINYCWYKLCLFLGNRGEDHRRTRIHVYLEIGTEVFAPADKQCFSEFVSPSCQVSIHSESYSVCIGKS